MNKLNNLLEHITARVNVNLRDPQVDVEPYIMKLVPRESHGLYYAFYALSTEHPVHFRFQDSSLSGTYFLGKCDVSHSVLYKSDVRGDELKRKGSVTEVEGYKLVLHDDEVIEIKHSFLVKTLVHCNSHDPENLESFTIRNTVALPYSNIHGARTEGCFIGCFGTVDLCVVHDCEIGEYAYVQAGDLSHERIDPGRIWVKVGDICEFDYTHPRDVVQKYISMDKNFTPQGEFIDFFEERKEDFVPIYASVEPDLTFDVPPQSYVSPYAVMKGDNKIGENVLVSQRAYIENSNLGTGANAQEHCYIIGSTYEGLNVTAHGGKVINCDMGRNTFTGFNSFLRGKQDARITIGAECIIMPHTIIDTDEPIAIPAGHLVWGYIRTQADVADNSISFAELSKSTSTLHIGRMTFRGSGAAFVDGFKGRINHILEENGAYYDPADESLPGHAQKTQNVVYSIIQPYPDGPREGMYPAVTIGPEDNDFL